MKLQIVAVGIGSLFLVGAGAWGQLVPVIDNAVDIVTNPYAIISDRNVFHLNPLPVEAPPEPPKVELPVVKISGFFRVGNQTKVYFCVVPKDSKEKPAYCSLSEGQKKDSLEVVKIHFDKGEVDIVNAGSPMTLSVKADGLSPKQETAANNQPAKSPHMLPPGVPRQPPGGPRGFTPGGGTGLAPLGLPIRPPPTPGAE